MNKADSGVWTTPDFTKCLIKYNSPIVPGSIYEFLNVDTNILKSKNPKFESITQNKLNILQGSDAIDFGADVGVPLDILGNPRDVNPDLGAYEFQ